MLFLGVSGVVGECLRCAESGSVRGVSHGAHGNGVAGVGHSGIESYHQTAERVVVGVQHFRQDEILFSARRVGVEIDGVAAAMSVGGIAVCIRISVWCNAFVAFGNAAAGGAFKIFAERDGSDTAAVHIGSFYCVVFVDVIEIIRVVRDKYSIHNSACEMPACGVVEVVMHIAAGVHGVYTIVAIGLYQVVEVKGVAQVGENQCGNGVCVGEVNLHFAQCSVGINRDGGGTLTEDISENFSSIQGYARHTVIGIWGNRELYGACAATTDSGLVGSYRGVNLVVATGNNGSGDNGLWKNCNRRGVCERSAITGAGYRIGGCGGRAHRDGCCSGSGAPLVRVIAESGYRDRLARTDADFNGVHTCHVGHHWITVVDAVVHLEGISKVCDDRIGLHVGLRYFSAVAGTAGSGYITIRITVVHRSTPGRHGSVVGTAIV